MYEASLAGVIKTVLIIFLVYFGLKIFFRWFGPSILKYFLGKVGGQFEKQFRQQQDAYSAREKEGKVSIDKKPPNSHKSKKNVGEYIDYEEID